MKKRKIRVEGLENRNLLAGDVGDDISEVIESPFLSDGDGDIVSDVNNFAQVTAQRWGRLQILGDNTDQSISINQVGNGVVVDQERLVSFSTGFENLANFPDTSPEAVPDPTTMDVTEFTIGNEDLNATFSGNAAGTRRFRPGYNNDAFALITAGRSTIDFNIPADVTFFLRDIVELGAVVPGFENVVGSATLVGENGIVTIDATDNGDPQSNNWDFFDSRDFNIGGITQIVIDNTDADGNPTGVTNIDDLTFSAVLEQSTSVSNVRRMVVFARDGDDFVLNNTNIRSTLFGHNGDDVLIGGSSRDTIFGGIGNDTLNGGDGYNTLFGQDGDDDLVGGNGRDVLFGGDGDDSLDGGRGKDIFFGGRGSDVIVSNDGFRDLIFADVDDLLETDARDRVIVRRF